MAFLDGKSEEEPFTWRQAGAEIVILGAVSWVLFFLIDGDMGTLNVEPLTPTWLFATFLFGVVTPALVAMFIAFTISLAVGMMRKRPNVERSYHHAIIAGIIVTGLWYFGLWYGR